MARLVTLGAESGAISSEYGSDGVQNGGLFAPTIDSTTKRSGSFSFKLDSTASPNTTLGYFSPFSQATNRNYFYRDYVNFAQFPASTIAVLAATFTGPTQIASIRVTSAGVVQLWNEQGTPAQIGSDGPTLSTGTFYRLELEVRVATGGGAASTAKARVDGTEFAATTTANLGTTGPAGIIFGWASSPGASKVAYHDDIAVNDDQGANQNTYPGDGKVVMLVPISDNARASLWTGGTGGTTSLFDAVNNTPPVGTATETNTSQIEHAGGAAGTTDAYDANMTTYTNAGIGAGATINVITPTYNHGEDVTTGTKLLNISIVSNPAIASIGNIPAGQDVGLLGTFPSNWRSDVGVVTHAPSVTLGTSPVMRVTRPETATRVASVDFMGMIVDYTPAPVSGALPPRRSRLSRFTQLRS